MKTTVDLPPELVRAAKRAALERHTTLKELVMRGLQREISNPGPENPEHPLRSIQALGRGDWEGQSADRYVAEQRAGWE